MPTPSRYYTEPPYKARKSVTFTGAANLGNAGDNVPIFDVTGEVYVEFIVAYCSSGLDEAVGGATISLGMTGAVTALIAATNTVDVDTGEFWVDNAPDGIWVAVPSGLKAFITDTDIVVACAVQDTDTGTLEFTAYWKPLSDDGDLAAA
jgi:hypothetical protein